MMKNKYLFIVVLFIILLMPTYSFATDDVLVPIDDVNQVNQIEDFNENLTSENLPENIPVTDEQNFVMTDEQPAITYKKPITKKKLVKKFIQAMLYVGVLSALLYCGLLLYKKMNRYSEPLVRTPEGETPLTVPNDIESAVKLFMDKTKW